MIDIHVIAQDQVSLDIQEWDVKTINGTLLGVIEEYEDGYVFTDSFGHLTTFFEGESLMDVSRWVGDDINRTLKH